MEAARHRPRPTEAHSVSTHQHTTHILCWPKCHHPTLFPVSAPPPLSILTLCPDAADAESPLKDSELQVLRSQYLKEQEAEHITVQTKFNYAWGLIKSDRHDDQLEGVKLLTGIPRHIPGSEAQELTNDRNLQRSSRAEKGMFILFGVGTV